MRRFFLLLVNILSVLLLVFVFCIIKPNFSTAANNNGYIAEQGLIVSYGNGFVGESHRSYRVASFIYHIGFKAHSIFPSLVPPNNGRFTLYLEPQYDTVTRPSGNYEFGLGFGLEYRFKIIKRIDGYMLAGSGLHYISFDSSKQSGGFNFNDNLGCGLYLFTSKHSAVNLGFRFRHISNADLNMPNEGINSYLFVLGYSWFF